jgi:hypothetical protein
MSDKALKACADYARLNAEIRRLTKAIGDALDGCPGENGKRACITKPDGQIIFGGDDDPTHLKAAYTPETVDGDYCSGPELEWLSDEAIREHLSGVCPACLAAHGFIQERKSTRRQFGAVKRAIGTIGRAANKRSAK